MRFHGSSLVDEFEISEQGVSNRSKQLLRVFEVKIASASESHSSLGPHAVKVASLI